MKKRSILFLSVLLIFGLSAHAQLSVTATVDNNVSCFNGADGAATANPSGGTAPYTYLWDDPGSQVTQTITGLTAGSYCVTATDALGATATACVIITEPTAVTATIVSATNISCYGGNGSATVVGTGGTPPYSYIWPTGNTAATDNGLWAGSYCPTVIDANGCSASTCVTITEPSTPVTVNATVTSNYNGYGVSIIGACDGEGTAVASGGVAPYSYVWPGGTTTAVATGLCAGSNCVTVFDANGCQASGCITLTEPSMGTITSQSNVTCHGANDGSVTIAGTNGVPPYSYDIGSGPQATGTFTNLPAGAWVVSVTDVNGLQGTVSFVITEPAPLQSTLTNLADVSCNGGSNGQFTIDGVGGTSPYAYSFQGGAYSASNSFSNLSVGTYYVGILDMNGCMHNDTVIIGEPAALSLSITYLGSPTCYYAFDGSATATVSGGVPGYAYSWDNGETTATATGLTLGNHCVTATDANGCMAVACISPNIVAGIDTSYLVAPDSTFSFCVPYSATATGASWYTINGHGSMADNGNGCFTYFPGGPAEHSDTLYIHVCDTGAIFQHKVVMHIASCVWAGDTDTSQLVNNFDLLPIGQYYGTTGMPRPNADLNFDCEPMYDWSIVPLYTVDPKHSDCNGDGTVNDDDTLAITQNWGQLYVKSGSSSKNGVQIYVDTATTSPGDVVNLGVVLGNNTLPANNIYGVAFTVTYNSGMVKPNSVSMSYGNSWLGTDGINMLTIEKDFYNLGEVEVGMVRTDQQLVSGSGPICELQLTIKDDVLRKSRRLDLDITDVKLIDLAGNVIQTNPQPSSVLIDNPTGIAQTASQEFEVQVFPNPSKGVVNVRLSEAQPTQLELYTATGQLLQSKQINSNTHQLDISDLPKGVYMLSVQTEKGRVVKQIVRL